MSHPLRVVHYLNPFFAGLGGEEQANLPVCVKREPIGPGRTISAQLTRAIEERLGISFSEKKRSHRRRTAAKG